MDFDTIKDTFSSYINKEEQSIDKYGSMGKCQRILSKVKKVTFGMIPLIGHSGKGKTIRTHRILVVAKVEYGRRQWQPTPVLLPGDSQGRGSLVGSRLGGRAESDTTKAT